MIRSRNLCILWVQLCLFASNTSLAERGVIFPEIAGETLSGKDFKLPRDFDGKTVYLVIGFTKESKKATSNCSDLLRQKLVLPGYSIAILEGVPFFIKGLIKNSIRSTTSENRRDFYLILNEGKSELSQLTGFDKEFEDDAYVLLLKPKVLEKGSNVAQNSYEIVFRSHGTCNDTHIRAVTQEVGKINP